MTHLAEAGAPAPDVPMALTYRPGTIEDLQTVFSLIYRTNADFGERLGLKRFSSMRDPDVIAERWRSQAPVYEHVARTAEHFWIAERDGQPVGVAQSILRDGTRLLTLFYVETDQQSQGIGRELLLRAFPREATCHRAIVASIDMRALARYLKAGVYPRSPLYSFSRQPETVTVATDLVTEPASATHDALAALREVDRATLGFSRDADHEFLLTDRQGYLYRRDGRVAGYGYLGKLNGPFALLDARDFPAVLAHAEREAAARGDELGLLVPLVNQVAVDYLLERGFKMDSFFLVLMTDEPLPHLDRYIPTRPVLFM